MRTAHRLFLAAVIVLGVCGSARAQDDGCGGPWQPACMYWEPCAWKFLGVWCVGQWLPTPAWNGCDSSRYNNVLLTCVPCGGTGQGECWYQPRCNAWHNPLGLCYACGGSGQPVCWSQPECQPTLRNAFGWCSYAGHSDEPTTNVTGLPSLAQPGSGTDPVLGIADVHNHQFANLGFGGVVFWGAPYDPRGIDAALAWCDYTWDFATGYLLPPLKLWTPVWTPMGYEVHGPKATQWVTAPVSAYDREGVHDVGGTGLFDGWPKYNTMTHQQMYYKWLERAYQGGLRLMVMHAISSEAICQASKVRGGWDCDDMKAVDRQIQAVKELERAIDRMDDNLDNGTGWYRIAYSPQQARQIIRQGKMAVVLGIEVDSLFGCKRNAGCTRDDVRAQLEKYHQAGVRHIYPIHHYDNEFGGSAVFLNMLNTGNALVSGEHFSVRDCSAPEDGGYTFNIGEDAFGTLGVLLGVPPPDMTYYNRFDADCNDRGLTPLGQEVIEEMMAQKFIIDVDHMSRLMLDTVLGMADSHQPKYPLVSGHTNFLSRGTEKSEMSLTDAQVALMRDIGGMITVTTIPSACGTSREFVDKYRFAKGKMAGGPLNKAGEQGFDGVALGTDFNGWGTQVRPRFGLAACPSDDPYTGLPYPFGGLFGGSFGRQVTGQREFQTPAGPRGLGFDFNVDGLAHVGLLPDLIADAQKVGLGADELDVLLNSAETYIRMWERIDNSDKLPPPMIEEHVEGTLGDGGWYRSVVTVTWEVTTSDPANNQVTSTSGCGPQTIAADTTGLTITCTATTGSGASTMSTTRSVTIKRDTTPPAVAATASPSPGTWTSGDIAVHFEASDATSGMVGDKVIDMLFGTEGANQTVSHTFRDLAGNTAVASVSGLNIDRTPPEIRFRFADLPPDATDEEQLAQLALWHNQDVHLVVEATDALSGVAAGSPVPALLVLSQEGPGVHGTATATDVAGNTAAITSFDLKIDKTPPTIMLASRSPVANDHGWNNTDVTVTWTCADALAGPVAETVATTVSAEGTNMVATGTCADLAGNTASAEQGDINIDRTPPAVQVAASPPSNDLGWNNTTVTVTFTASDALSGIEDEAVVDVPISDEGIDLFATWTFVDRAGNEASSSLGGIKIDKTAPTLTCVPTPSSLWPPNHVLVPVAIALEIADGLSGAGEHLLASAASSEADNGLGDGDTAGDIVGFVPGGTALAGALRAERSGRGSGRTYTLNYQGFDRAGNRATCGTEVEVPRNQGNAAKR